MQPIISVIGTRPNYMKIAPIMAAFAEHNPPINHLLVHTGQHYDANMERVFFEALKAPAPDFNLQVGAGTHAIQTGEIMKRLDPVLESHRPAAVLVVGDVNSTLGAALVAAKRGIPLIHVESGLRSGDRKMPEEINRILTDQMSDLLFTTEAAATQNLIREGIDEAKIVFAGNVMIDSLVRSQASAISVQQTLISVRIDPQSVANGYAVVTLHRPSNVDDPVTFARLIKGLNHIAESLPIVFPIHPRTSANLDRFNLRHELKGHWHLLPPQGYFEMIGLMRDAAVVLTDSGGVQEETTMLGTPCFTLRENTERPITIEHGTNQLIGTQTEAIVRAFEALQSSGSSNSRRPPLWDGKSAQRIAQEIWRRRIQFGW